MGCSPIGRPWSIFYSCLFGFILNSVTIGGAVASCGAGTCHKAGFFFSQSHVVADHALHGHHFRTLSAAGPRECFRECSVDCRCVSFNTYAGGERSSCQLNEENRHTKPDALKPTQGFNYYDLEIDYNIQVGQTCSICSNHCCKSSPCQNNGTCRETCAEHGPRFTCSCPPEYTGKYCESEAVWNSCHEAHTAGVIASGIYLLYNPELVPFSAYCDFANSESAGAAWTLIESFSLDNKGAHNISFYAASSSINQKQPTNWATFRFAQRRAVRIAEYSTHWRATCNFEQRGTVYQDYIRANLTENNILLNPRAENGYCAKYEFVNIRGHHCVNCTALTYHYNYHFHIDSFQSAGRCDFDGTSGAADSEDNFGEYVVTNPLFSCTAGGNSTTQFWLGNL